MHNECA